MLFLLGLLTALAAADAFTGFIHYLEDEHPGVFVYLFGEFGDREIVQPNQRHHVDPFEMTRNTYADRVFWSCVLAAPFMALGIIIGSKWLILVALFGSQSNQVHYWAHVPRPPAFIRLLQRLYILQCRRHHSRHHAEPHNVRYCVMTPWLNPIIDGIRKELST